MVRNESRRRIGLMRVLVVLVAVGALATCSDDTVDTPEPDMGADGSRLDLAPDLPPAMEAGTDGTADIAPSDGTGEGTGGDGTGDVWPTQDGAGDMAPDTQPYTTSLPGVIDEGWRLP